MSLNVNIGGMSFKLAVSADVNLPTLFSVKYSPKDGEGERDAVVELADFSGTLRICKADVSKLLEKKNESKKTDVKSEATSIKPKQIEVKSEKEVETLNVEKKDATSKSKEINVKPGKVEKTVDEENVTPNIKKDEPIVKPKQIPVKPEKKQTTTDVKESEDVLREKSQAARSIITGHVDFESNVYSEPTSTNLLSKSSSTPTKSISFGDEVAPSDTDASSDRNKSKVEITKLAKSGPGKGILVLNKAFAKLRVPTALESSVQDIATLHSLCRMQNVLVKKLEESLKFKPSAASKRDDNGMLPLHIITENDELVFGFKQKLVKSFVHQLIKAYPKGVAVTDFTQRIPFTSRIVKWIDDVHTSTEIEEYKLNESLKIALENPNPCKVILNVEIPAMVDWCFKMLSEQYVEKQYCNNAPESMSHVHDPVMKNFCSIPLILKSVLLVEKDFVRIQILELPIFKQALLNTNLIGDWVVFMLSSETHSKRVIDLFELLSNLTISEAFDIYRRPRVQEKQIFIGMRNALINKIADMNGVMSALTHLEPPELSRACGTIVVQQIIDTYMVLPGVTYYYLFNLSMSMLLMLSFHVFVDLKSNDVMFNVLFSPFPLIIFICVVFLLKDELLNFAAAKKTNKLRQQIVRRYTNVANLFNLGSVVAVMGMSIQMVVSEKLPSIWLLAIVKMLTWAPIVQILKGINQSLASFVFSLVTMAFSLIWCLMIFFLVIVIFSNTMTFLFKHNGECIDDGYAEDPTHIDFCSDSSTKSFMRAYSVIIGDVSLESYNGSPFSSFMFFGYSMIGVIFFLNVIIAVVNRSYEESFSQQNRVLGMYRIPFLAKQHLLQKIMEDANRFIYTIFCIIFIGGLQCCLFSYFYTWSYAFAYQESELIFRLSILVTVILNLSLVIITMLHMSAVTEIIKKVTNLSNITDSIHMISQSMHDAAEGAMDSVHHASEVNVTATFISKGSGAASAGVDAISGVASAGVDAISGVAGAGVDAITDAATAKIKFLWSSMQKFSYWLFGIQEQDAADYEPDKLENIESLCQHNLLKTKQLVDDSEYRILTRLDKLQLHLTEVKGES